MICRSLCVLAVTVGLLIAWARPAMADTACPTSTSSISENLYIYGFDVAKLGEVHWDAPGPPSYPYTPEVYMGNFPFYGASAVGVCVRYTTGTYPNFTLHEEVYVVTDHNNNLLGWLPLDYNHMCSMYNGAPNEFEVVYNNTTLCGVNFSPLNYHGNMLLVYAGGGGDHFHGGLGEDAILGGAGQDDIDDWGSTYGEVWGEEDNDFCFGSYGSSTQVWGGSGNDELCDGGGYQDSLYGGYGNECCVRDYNDNVWVESCGAGTADSADSSAASSDCERTCQDCDYAPNGISCWPGAAPMCSP